MAARPTVQKYVSIAQPYVETALEASQPLIDRASPYVERTKKVFQTLHSRRVLFTDCPVGSWGELLHRSLRLPHCGEGEHGDHRGQGLLHSSDSRLGRKLPQDPLRRGGGHEQLLSVRAYSFLSRRNVYRILRSPESCPMTHFEFWQRHQRQAFSLMNLIRFFYETGNSLQNKYGLIYAMDLGHWGLGIVKWIWAKINELPVVTYFYESKISFLESLQINLFECKHFMASFQPFNRTISRYYLLRVHHVEDGFCTLYLLTYSLNCLKMFIVIRKNVFIVFRKFLSLSLIFFVWDNISRMYSTHRMFLQYVIWYHGIKSCWDESTAAVSE